MNKENKQITIYDLLPLLKPGWVAMDKSGAWFWFLNKPLILNLNDTELWGASDAGYLVNLSNCFDIATFNGDWKDSLIKCGNKK